MSTSRERAFLSEICEGGRIPEAKIAYFEQRALNGFYDYVMGRFEEERQASGLTKAELARRIGRGQDQVSRLLASPGNWTIGTLARLLLGISGEEPILQSKVLKGRPPQNVSVHALLDDAATVARGGTAAPETEAGSSARNLVLTVPRYLESA